MSGQSIDDPALLLSQLFLLWPETAEVFLSRGTACFGCPIARFHTVAEACAEYDLDVDVIRAELRAAVLQRSGVPG